MNDLFRFPDAVRRSSAIDQWMLWQKGDLGKIAQHWFEAMRECGSDVRDLVHDGHPTACVADAAFAYVDTFTAHVNVGFYRGAELPDPKGMLEGSGKLMRHVKIHRGQDFDSAALSALIIAAYADMKRRVQHEKTEAAGGQVSPSPQSKVKAARRNLTP